jgi:hypothetical protein
MKDERISLGVFLQLNISYDIIPENQNRDRGWHFLKMILT